MEEGISTIQIRENIKGQLNRLKIGRESYEEVILKLIVESEKKKGEQEQLLIEQCKVMAEDDLRICKEWEATDADLDWEW